MTRFIPASILSAILVSLGSLGCASPGRTHSSSGIAATPNWSRVEPLPASPTTAATQPADEIVWHDARPLDIEGKAWNDTEDDYDRLPARAKANVTQSVWGLSKCSAGMGIRFGTDASRIHLRWTLTNSSLAMPHMPATGVSGLDLYVRWEGRWHWVGAGRPHDRQSTGVVNLALPRETPPARHEFMLYLPLYNGVKSVNIGLPRGSTLYKVPPRADKPILVYGTSICQGGCASRPGMAHIAILGRRLDRPTINLGFSGSGKMEPAMADLLAELDVAAYVLDCLPNMTTQMVRERVEPFIRTLRKARPTTPIVLVESVISQGCAFLPESLQNATEENRVLRSIYDRLIGDGMTGLWYVRGRDLLGDDGEGTVDGVHATDLGFHRMAAALDPVIRKALAR